MRHFNTIFIIALNTTLVVIKAQAPSHSTTDPKGPPSPVHCHVHDWPGHEPDGRTPFGVPKTIGDLCPVHCHVHDWPGHEPEGVSSVCVKGPCLGNITLSLIVGFSANFGKIGHFASPIIRAK